MARNTFLVKAKISAQDDTARGVRSAESRFKGFGSAISALRVQALAAGVAIAGAFKAIESSSTLETQTQALRANLASQGQDFDAYLAKLNQVAEGTISTANLIESSSNALLLGIPANEIASLLEIARVSAAATGSSVAAAFDDIALGIGRASPMILDNLGLTIKLGPAYEAMADGIGKSADALTAAEQKQAILNEVLRVGGERVALFAGALTAQQLALQQSSATFQNWGKVATDAIASVSFGLGSLVAASASGLVAIAQGAASAADAFLSLGAASGLFGDRLDAARAAVSATRDSLDETRRAALEYGIQLKDAALATGALVVGLSDAESFARDVAAALNSSAEAADKLTGATTATTTATAALGKALGVITSAEVAQEIDAITKALEASAVELGANSDEYIRLEQIAGEKVRALREELERTERGVVSLKNETVLGVDAFDAYGASAQQGGQELDTFRRGVDDTTRALERQARIARETGDALASVGGGGGGGVGTTGFQFQGGRFAFDSEGRRVRVLPDGSVERAG